MPLEEYRRKRDFTRTPEPSDDARPGAAVVPGVLFPGWEALPAGRRFCVQMHAATRLHWDVRLELGGVLLSWAVPLGPTLDPARKRLAVRTEDHPLPYGGFEGVIPAGYGAGTVELWDAGTVRWTREAEADPAAALVKGDLKFALDGVKLRGEYALVHSGRRTGDERQWLLIKKRDEGVVEGFEAAAVDISVLSGRTLEGVRAGAKPLSRTRARAALAALLPPSTGSSAPPRAARPAVAQGNSAHPGPAASSSSAQAPAPLPASVLAAPVRRLPGALAPMLATAGDRPFDRAGWWFELKYDGVRALATVRDGALNLRSRRGRDETRRYPELSVLGRLLAVDDAVLDGEVVALDDEGRPSFELLQRRINAREGPSTERLRAEVPAVFMVFDILSAAGHDLRDLPLTERRAVLRAVLREDANVRIADHVETRGIALFEAAAARGVEGVVAKDATARYEAGRRSGAWVKLRAWRVQDCAVCGVTPGKGGRGAIGALMLGAVREGRLVPCGRVGSGLDADLLQGLHERLMRARTDAPPFEGPIADDPTGVIWVRPEVVVSVRHMGWTRSGTLRQPTFRGLREDLTVADCSVEGDETAASALPTADAVAEGARASAPAAAEAKPPRARSSRAAKGEDAATADPMSPATARRAVRKRAAGRPPAETVPRPTLPDPRHTDALTALASLPAAGGLWEIDGHRLPLTNLDKQLWPGDGITKRDLVTWYVTVAPLLLPHLRDRAVGTQVFPDGINGKHFWRKRVPDHAPTWIPRWTWHGDSTVTYLLVEEAATLAWMANAAVIDIHPWHSRVDHPDQPDWAVFDLDPFPPATFDDVRHIARMVHTALDHYGLTGYPKVSGQTGVQIHVPLERGPAQDVVRAWVEQVARAIGALARDLVSFEWSVARRNGRIRIDYTQNVTGKTLAAPYSVRPAPGAPVSIPVTWDELDAPGIHPAAFTIRDVLPRLRRTGDLFAPVLLGTQRLPG